jgi:hypothetical protein
MEKNIINITAKIYLLFRTETLTNQKKSTLIGITLTYIEDEIRP